MFTNPRSVSSISQTQKNITRPFSLNLRPNVPNNNITFKGQPISTFGVEGGRPMSSKETTTLPLQEPVKKMKWGEPFWFLFHTMAEKVKDELFPSVREELLNLIYTICINLPCPDCSKHATQYLNGIHFKRIQSKSELKEMLFIFHNVVNKKKNIPLFSREDLDTKYSNALMIPILNNFMVHFRNKKSSIQMIANDFHRERIFKELQNWFNKNIHIFQL
jgi:hypothetical protein